SAASCGPCRPASQGRVLKSVSGLAMPGLEVPQRPAPRWSPRCPAWDHHSRWSGKWWPYWLANVMNGVAYDSDNFIYLVPISRKCDPHVFSHWVFPGKELVCKFLADNYMMCPSQLVLVVKNAAVQ